MCVCVRCDHGKYNEHHERAGRQAGSNNNTTNGSSPAFIIMPECNIVCVCYPYLLCFVFSCFVFGLLAVYRAQRDGENAVSSVPCECVLVRAYVFVLCIILMACERLSYALINSRINAFTQDSQRRRRRRSSYFYSLFSKFLYDFVCAFV